MYLKLDHPPVRYENYVSLIDPQLAANLDAVRSEMGNQRVLHLNSTATGGGVAEVLQSMVPLSNSLGIETERIVINPPYPEFFQATKKIHNLLQGAEGSLTGEEWEVYFRSIKEVARAMKRDGLKADVWVLHDPQLLPLAQFLREQDGSTWLWVCHIDLTTPNDSVLDTLLPLTSHFDHLVFSLQDYVPDGLDSRTPVYIAPPAIDPLSVKNTAMPEDSARSIVSAMGIDPNRPLISQVSRFDLWKDPWGVVDAFRTARESVPGLQLALLGLSQATDDPEALDVLASVRAHAAGDPDIHLYYDPAGLPDTIDRIVNAFQVASLVLMQKSTREGFGLTVTEAMWKSRPVIGGNAGGIRTQIKDGVTGYLVSSPEECARRIVELVQSPVLRLRIGADARESVRQRFLLPRLTHDYLSVAQSHRSQRQRTYANGADEASALEHLIPGRRPQFQVGAPNAHSI